MAEKGIEVMVGVSENEQFGKFILFGMGGIFAEVLEDYSLRLIPLTREDAEEMIRETKGYRILKGYRNFKADIENLTELLLRVSEMVERENIAEMDLNPVFAYEDGYMVVDARIRIGRERRELRETNTNLIREILNAKSIAVVGASSNPLKVGYSVIKSLSANKKLRIYPINPKLNEIDGLRVYKSIAEIPEDLDLVVIAVPSEKVLQVVEEAAEKTKGIFIISSGFREAEIEYGAEMQNRLKEVAEKNGIRIFGPNSFGMINVGWMNASFTPMFNEMKAGKVALVSQSGGICHYIMHNFRDVGFSYIIHLGNRCDVDFPDIIRFLNEDERTEIITLYIEGLDYSRELVTEIKRCSKPVIAMKAGKSKKADKVSKSHTGSLAGDYRLYVSSLHQAGALVVENPTQLIDVARIIEMTGFRGGGIAIATIQAGLGFIALDEIETNGGIVAELEENTVRGLKEILPPITMRENPLDLSFSGLNTDLLKESLNLLQNDSNVGAIMFLYAVSPPSWIIPVEVFIDVFKDMKKPVIVVYSSTDEDYNHFKSRIEALNIPVFSSIERASKALAVVSRWLADGRANGSIEKSSAEKK